MVEMPLRDVCRDIVDTVMMVGGIPALILDAVQEKEGILLSCRGIGTNTLPYTHVFSLATVKPFQGRIGMVNSSLGGVFYVRRQPARRLHMGITIGTCIIDTVCSPLKDVSYSQLRRWTNPLWEQTLTNTYPSFKEAFHIAKQHDRGCAFDRQFAVDSTGKILYRGATAVGTIPRRAVSLRNLQLYPEFQHLQVLIDNNYEKTIRTFSASSN